MFLQLPRELRDQIYRELLRPPSGLAISTVSRTKKARYRPISSQDAIYPEILTACRQIYEEARLIFYESNTFYMRGHPQTFPYFFDSLSDQNRRVIRHIKFQDPIPLPSFVAAFQAWKDLLSYLFDTLRLRTITIHSIVESEMFEPGTYSPFPASIHPSGDCWWPPARYLVTKLMQHELEELRIRYLAYRNPWLDKVAEFKDNINIEKLFGIRMLRIPRTEGDEIEERRNIRY
ncbi:MAG: hypothetical protein M1820_002548 [Bogoriella megaspora]|nr:MAG: hypothetical protein M1820_002548 [Bogoriella megaspora]